MSYSVEIKGAPGDLGLLRSVLLIVPGASVFDDGATVFVTNPEIAVATTPKQACEQANALLAAATRAALLLYEKLLELSLGTRVRAEDPAGAVRMHHVMTLEPAHFGFTGHPVTLTAPSRRQPKDEREVYFRAQASAPRLAQALQYIQTDDNEYGWYKAFEALRDENGGEPAIKNMGWATSDELDAFRAACHKERHDKPDRPKVKPMTERQARGFVIRLLQSWAKRIRWRLPLARYPENLRQAGWRAGG